MPRNRPAGRKVLQEPKPPSQARRGAGIAAAAYALLVLVMWAPYTLLTGFDYETSFPYNSEIAVGLKGFLYPTDALRVQMNTFYHLPYLIGQALGVQGSYIPYAAVYALLWWARGFLVFLILRKFLPRSLSVCYAAGALVVLHASDVALGWMGQMNQFGFIFWMILAFYLLTLAAESARWQWAALAAIGASLCEYMSLWSYESQLLILLVLPLSLLFRRCPRRKLGILCAAWYSVPATYIWLTAVRYFSAREHTYQSGVMRKGWSWQALAGDWGFNIAASLRFWKWPSRINRAPDGEVYAMAALGAILFVAGGLAMMRLNREDRRPNPFVERVRSWWILLGIGLVLLAFSFPVYLLLDSARELWRTQFLSGIGAGLALAAVCGLASHALRRQARVAAFLALGGAIAFCGSASAVQKGSYHRWHWERVRHAVAEVLRVAPSVQPNTLIVLTNVPKDADPFGHAMWMDMAIRLAYPGLPVGGVYFYSDGTPGRGTGLMADGRSWQWDGTGVATLVAGTGLANTLVIDSAAPGRGKLLTALPAYLCKSTCASYLYNPQAIVTGPISPIASHRYRVTE